MKLTIAIYVKILHFCIVLLIRIVYNILVIKVVLKVEDIKLKNIDICNCLAELRKKNDYTQMDLSRLTDLSHNILVMLREEL